MLVNLSLTLILMRPLAHVGIALATSAAGWVNALGLLTLLLRLGHFRLDRRARRNLPRIGAAALVMGGVLRLLLVAAAPALSGAAVWRIGALAGLVVAGLVVFGVAILAFGIADWRHLLGRERRQPA